MITSLNPRLNKYKFTKKNKNEKISFDELLLTIKGCNLNRRLEKFKALTKQYKLNFSNLASLMELLYLFPEKNQLELVNIPEVWVQVKIKFAEIGKRPALPLNQKETSLLLKKLGEVYNFQNFLRKFSVATERDQINLLLQFQQVKPKFLTEYLKTSQNITELFRWIPETLMSHYFKLPIIDSAIEKMVFSWNDIVGMLKTTDNGVVYLFIDHLLTKNKLTETLDIEQLKILLIGLNYDKRSNFIDYLYSKKFISQEIKPADFIRLAEICFFKNDFVFIQTKFVQEQLARISFSGEDIDDLFSSLPGLEDFLVKQLKKQEDQLNNNTSKCNSLFFENTVCKRQSPLSTIDEECDANNSVNKNLH